MSVHQTNQESNALHWQRIEYCFLMSQESWCLVDQSCPTSPFLDNFLFADHLSRLDAESS